MCQPEHDRRLGDGRLALEAAGQPCGGGDRHGSGGPEKPGVETEVGESLTGRHERAFGGPARQRDVEDAHRVGSDLEGGPAVGLGVGRLQIFDHEHPASAAGRLVEDGRRRLGHEQGIGAVGEGRGQQTMAVEEAGSGVVIGFGKAADAHPRSWRRQAGGGGVVVAGGGGGQGDHHEGDGSE